MTFQRSILAIVALAAPLVAGGSVVAQDRGIPEIVVTPSGPGGTGYYGAYGRDLPGVYMLSGSNLPVTPEDEAGQLGIPGTRDIISNHYTYQQPLPVLDAWHGTIGPGLIRF